MTPSHTPESPRILCLHSGRLGDRVLSHLARTGARITAVPISAPDLRAAPEDYTAVVLASDRPFPVIARALDAACWTAGIPWTSGVLLAHCFHVGPAVLPGRTPCYECWSLRVRSQSLYLEAHDALEAKAARDVDPWFDDEWAPLTEQAAALLAAEVIALTAGNYVGPDNRLGRFWEGDALAGTLVAHQFARLGHCQRCARGEERVHGA